MRFFPRAVKQPLLSMLLKKERKEKEKDRKFKQSSNKQEACLHCLKITFIVGQRKYLLVENFGLAEREF